MNLLLNRTEIMSNKHNTPPVGTAMSNQIDQDKYECIEQRIANAFSSWDSNPFCQKAKQAYLDEHDFLANLWPIEYEAVSVAAYCLRYDC